MPLNLDKLRRLMLPYYQAEIAAKCGVTQAHISQILSGTRPNVPLATLERLAAALGVKAKDLLE